MKLLDDSMIAVTFKALVPNAFIVYVFEFVEGMTIDDIFKLIIYAVVGFSTAFYYIQKALESRTRRKAMHDKQTETK